ncbi:hypothetical protein OG786_29155 [Streptomyces sp. NBC_00101]|uniref:hypothetical protein n=1 Tax=Streptomyces sp. NBC_00101 TaxID=2975651 RepID=UPI003248FEB3
MTSTPAEHAANILPALVGTIRELQALQQPLVDALRSIREDMDRASRSGDEWAMEWLGDVWSEFPLEVRAAGGDQEAAHELAAKMRGTAAAPAAPAPSEETV